MAHVKSTAPTYDLFFVPLIELPDYQTIPLKKKSTSKIHHTFLTLWGNWSWTPTTADPPYASFCSITAMSLLPAAWSTVFKDFTVSNARETFSRFGLNPREKFSNACTQWKHLLGFFLSFHTPVTDGETPSCQAPLCQSSAREAPVIMSLKHYLQPHYNNAVTMVST